MAGPLWALAPNFWPRIVAGLVVVMGLWMVIRPAPANTTETKRLMTKSHLLRLVFVWVVLTGFYFAIPRFGLFVPAAEAGNNRVAGATMIPLLALGVPGDVITAVILGAFMIHG